MLLEFYWWSTTFSPWVKTNKLSLTEIVKGEILLFYWLFVSMRTEEQNVSLWYFVQVWDRTDRGPMYGSQTEMDIFVFYIWITGTQCIIEVGLSLARQILCSPRCLLLVSRVLHKIIFHRSNIHVSRTCRFQKEVWLYSYLTSVR